MGDAGGVSTGGKRSVLQQDDQTAAGGPGEPRQGRQPPAGPRGEKPIAAGILGDTGQPGRVTKSLPPSPPCAGGAAPLAAFTLQAPAFPFQNPAPFRFGDAHDVVAQGPHHAAPPQAAAAPVLSDADRARVDAFFAGSVNPTGDDVYEALQSLSRPAQRYLIDRAFDCVGLSGFGDLARRVQGDASVRRVVAEALIERAIQLEGRRGGSGGSLDANDPHNYARAYVQRALIALNGDKAGLVGLIDRMSPQQAALFAQALDDSDRPDTGERMPGARNQVLAALNGAPHTDATKAIVENLYLQTSPGDLASTSGLVENMALAVAREYHPGDTDKARAEIPRLEGLMRGPGAELQFGGSIARRQIAYVAIRDPEITAQLFESQSFTYYYQGNPARVPVVAEAMARARIAAADGPLATVDTPADENTKLRLGGILQTVPGQQLLFSGTPEAAAIALLVIRTHPEITFETFGGMNGKENPWLNPALAKPVAEAYAAGWHNGKPQPVPGAWGVDTMVGFCMNMVPTLPRGDGWKDLFKECPSLLKKVIGGEALSPAEWKQFELIASVSLYDKPEHAIVHKIADKIRHIANTNPPRVDCVHVTLFNEYGPIQCPLFRVQNGIDANGCATYAYVDNTGADYDSLEDWETHNKLADGVVYYLKSGDDSIPKLVPLPTPEANKSTAGKVADTTALVGCLAAGALAFVGSGGTAMLVISAAGMAWMTCRSVDEVAWRHAHGLSINPLTDPDALLLWSNIVATATGVGAIAGGAGVGRLAAAGMIGNDAAALAIRLLAGASRIGSAEALAAQMAAMLQHPEDVTPFDALQMALFGVMAAHEAAARPTARALPRQAAPPLLPEQLPLKTLRPAAAPPQVAQPAPAPPVQTPGYKLNRPVTPRPKPQPNVHSFPGQSPSKGRPIYDGTKRWSADAVPPGAVPPVPAGLLANQGRGGQPGAAPAHAGANAPSGPGPNRPPSPVDPNTRRMTGADKPREGSPDSDRTPAAPRGAKPARPARDRIADRKTLIELRRKQYEKARAEYEAISHHVLEDPNWGGEWNGSKDVLKMARIAYEKARALYETAADKFEERDRRICDLREYSERRDAVGKYKRLAAGRALSDAKLDEAWHSLAEAAEQLALEYQAMPKEITPETVKEMDIAYEKARRVYESARLLVEWQNDEMPEGVSAAAVEKFNEARDDFKRASEIMDRLQTYPPYLEYLYGLRKDELAAIIVERNKAAVALANESMETIDNPKPSTRGRLERAAAAYRDAVAARDHAREILDEWSKKFKEWRRDLENLRARTASARTNADP